MNRALATLLGSAFLTGTLALPTASADPAASADGEGVTAADSTAEVFTYIGESTGPTVTEAAGNPVSDACRRFAWALDLAALNYEEFAYAIAGNGNAVDYRDHNVSRSNVIGRTALREAAYTALSASRTPGLPPEVSAAMRTWSLGATKLIVVMGLRGGGDSLNSNANELNAEADAAQLACAEHGGNG